KTKEFSSEVVLDIVHTNLCGPMRTKGLKGERYFILFVDDYSRRTCIMHLKYKLEVLNCFKRYRRLAENESGRKIKVLRSDQGTEFTNEAFEDYLEKHGIHHQMAAVRTP
ncbi:integrase catalytic domain-containing protein, partial [Escherichia coli]|uniref:integrase catalytic domain-containing protein n=1 Tax=Escherichia coli TaxID=562 RepID=UPI003F435799